MREQEPVTPPFGITPLPQGWLRCRDNNRARFTVRPSFRSIQTRIRYARPTGIRFEYQTPLERGTVLALQLQTGMTGISCIRTARVVDATPEGDGYLIDCTITPPFSANELDSLLPYSR
jgi:hypothetical protein